MFNISCGDDDAGPNYEFKDQILQGKIEGKTYQFKDGYFEESFFEEDKFSIQMYDVNEPDDACDVFSSDFVQVFFSIPKEVGLYKLKFNLSTFTGQTATLYDPDESLNVIATEGAIEILTISETEITGRMDARADNRNFVNGDFSVISCQIE